MEAVVNQEPTTDPVQYGEPAQAFPSAERSIFRAEARQHYIQRQQRVVMPRLASPRIFVYLWMLALFLTALGSIIAFLPLIGRLW